MPPSVMLEEVARLNGELANLEDARAEILGAIDRLAGAGSSHISQAYRYRPDL